MDRRSYYFYFRQGLAVPGTVHLGQFQLTGQLPASIGGGLAGF
jgi:hypothetical protein